jgi:hypothetical protein
VHRPAADIADQEDAVMAAAGVAVGDIGIGALDPAGQVGLHEQIEDPVDRVGRHPLAAALGDILGNVIGRGRTVLRGEGVEHLGPHVGPLFARIGQRVARSLNQAGTRMLVVMMITCHDADIGGNQPRVKSGL